MTIGQEVLSFLLVAGLAVAAYRSEDWLSKVFLSFCCAGNLIVTLMMMNDPHTANFYRWENRFPADANYSVE